MTVPEPGPAPDEPAEPRDTAPNPAPDPEPAPNPEPTADVEPAPNPEPADEADRPGLGARLGADWTAVLVAAVLVLLAVTGLLPSIPFVVK
jgi:hypothetical protein